MEGSGILQTIAEVAIAVTGFTGIVVALDERGRATWTGFARARFRILLAGSLAALLLALLPFLLHHNEVPPRTVWSSCSALVAVFMVPMVVVDVRSFRRHADEIPGFERRAAPLVAGLGAALWLSQVLNALRLHAFGPYLAAPLWFLAFSALAFVRLLLDRDADG
jgi:hypothetical protein